MFFNIVGNVTVMQYTVHYILKQEKAIMHLAPVRLNITYSTWEWCSLCTLRIFSYFTRMSENACSENMHPQLSIWKQAHICCSFHTYFLQFRIHARTSAFAGCLCSSFTCSKWNNECVTWIYVWTNNNILFWRSMCDLWKVYNHSQTNAI